MAARSWRELRRRRSPVKFNACRESWTEEIVDLLFPGNPLICAGASASRFEILPRQHWRGRIAQQKLILPSPVSRLNRKASKPLRVGSRKFLVLEFTGPRWESLCLKERRHYGNEARYYRAKRDQQAALIWHLSRFCPLVAVVQRSGRSLQAWLYCEGQRESTLLKLMQHAVTLGANPKAWQKTHLVSVPDSGRERGDFQETVYLNPARWSRALF